MDAAPAATVKEITEVARLAACVVEVDHDCALIPRGAFMLNAAHEVIPNHSFEGLHPRAAENLCSYLHFRAQENLEKKSLLDREGLTKSLDFLDPADEDLPVGCWSLHFDPAGFKGTVGSVVTLRSLLWPGFVFYHVVGTRQYGSAYVGTGEKNRDIGFML